MPYVQSNEIDQLHEEALRVNQYWNDNNRAIYEGHWTGTITATGLIDVVQRTIPIVHRSPATVWTDRGLSVLQSTRSEYRRSSPTTYRYTHKIKIPKVQFSLGWELEANHAANRYPTGVDVTSDGSVDGDSVEYVVKPTLVKSIQYVLGLLKNLVHAPHLNTNKSCGFHVHISPKGVSLKKMRQWAIMCEILASKVEKEAFEAVPDARQENHYCRRIRPLQDGTVFQATKYNNDRRYNWLNTVEMFRPGGIRTIEVRLLGNTHRWKYLLAWSTFCLELADFAWDVMHNPFEIDSAIDTLKNTLSTIRDYIKPLEKKHEPLPQWVYSHIRSFGIDTHAWDRPLAKLVDSEAEIKGMSKVYYSDNQPTIEVESNDGLCPHEIDRENEGCIDCDHDEGNCEIDYCDRCIEHAHRNVEFCGDYDCRRCNERNLVPNRQNERVA